MKLGFIGLGKMGNNMVVKMLQDHQVVVWNRSSSKVEDLKFKIQNSKFKITIQNLKVSASIEDLVKQLVKPRIIWSMLPAGEATEEILGEVERYVEAGDIVIDGANSNFGDTQKRYEHFSKKGIRFLGIGVSGGIIAAKTGYPLMVGGNREAYDYIKPILDSLAVPNGGHEYFGEGGAGHFVKMVHNAIEYGYMQSIGEGFGIMDKAPYDLDSAKVAKLYTKGTLVSGFMMDRTVEVLKEDPKLEKIDGYIEASGEADWAIGQAKKENVPVGVIKRSLDFRTESRSSPKISSSFAARLVAVLRNVFGGHEVKKKS